MQVVPHNTYRVRAYAHSAADDRQKMVYSEPIVARNREDALAGAKKRLHLQGNNGGVEYSFKVRLVNSRVSLVVMD